MRLAVITMAYKPITPHSKGGTELWTANFIEESARRGHEIHFFAVQGSMEGKNVSLIPLLDKPIPEYYEDDYFWKDQPFEFGKQREKFTAVVYARALFEVLRRQKEYDIIIDSTADACTAFSCAPQTPFLIIGHLPVEFYLNFYSKVFGWPPGSTVVFPSQYQYDHATSIPDSHKVVIPHGFKLSSLHFNSRGGDHMLWMSRIHHTRMDKGVEDAVSVAENLNRRIRITGLVEPSSKDYFEKAIRPRIIPPRVIFEEQSAGVPIDRSATYGTAKLFLLPLKWEEPFGFVMMEAMACGTPVVAYARGAVPEVVADGVTGFIVNPSPSDIRGDFIVKKTGQEGLCEAVERIYALSPEEYSRMRVNCRARVEKHFTVQRMIDQYERLYTALKKQ